MDGYVCRNCGNKFDYPEFESFCYEEEYGILSISRHRTYGERAICPKCSSMDFEEYYLPKAIPADARLVQHVFPVVNYPPLRR